MSTDAKVVLITGAGRGIGAASAKLFASKGCHLVLLSRTAEELQAVRREIVQDFPDAQVLCTCCDVSNEEQVMRVFEEVDQHFGRLDVLINNAGFIAVKSFTELSLSVWNQTLGVNLTGVFLFSREAMKRMLPVESGCIVNISSLAGIEAEKKFSGFSAYSAAKAGVVALTQSLAVEFAETNIRIACVAPGAVDTKMLNDALPNMKTTTKPEDIAEEIYAACQQNSPVIKVLSNK